MLGFSRRLRFGPFVLALAIAAGTGANALWGQEARLLTAVQYDQTSQSDAFDDGVATEDAAAGGDDRVAADDGPCSVCPETGDEAGPVTLLGECGERSVGNLFDSAMGVKKRWDLPIGAGAWHWFHVDASGDNDGYGIEGLRGTYYWYLTADPEYDLGGGRKIGGHLEYRLRDGDTFRSFFDSKFWPYEAYGYYQSEAVGTFKAGQVWTRFGLDWDGVFFGNVPYFDGFKLDPDYGLSWERTTEVHEQLSVDSFVQFFFHEDGVNGSFGGADPESVAGYNERNTGVIRIVPAWTCCDGSSVALGLSALVGEIESSLPGLDDEVTAAWATDLTVTRGPWKVFGEVLQAFGTRNPARYVSGGPSNRLTDMLVGAHYTVGPVVLRTSYSQGWDANPDARHEMVVAGATVTLTENVDFYLEYVNEQVHGNETADRIEFFDSFQFVIHWHY